MKNDWIERGKPALLPVGLLLLWIALGELGLINTMLFPRLLDVLGTLGDVLANGELLDHVFASAQRILSGFIVGSILGIALGVLTGYFPEFRKVTSASIRFLRSIPIYAWIPMLILWCGIGESSKIIAIAMGVFFPVQLNVEEGVKNSDKRFIEVAHVLELSTLETLRRVVLPGALPFLFSGLRQGLSRACMIVVVAELIAASSGLGYLISDARLLFRPDLMIVGMLTIGTLGIALDQTIALVERRSLRWSNRLVA